MITVVNKHNHVPSPTDIYVGRGSDLGNPYTHLPHRQTLAHYTVKTRGEAIAKYKRWLDLRLASPESPQAKAFYWIVRRAKNNDITLVCYCKPAACHADYIKELVEKELSNESVHHP